MLSDIFAANEETTPTFIPTKRNIDLEKLLLNIRKIRKIYDHKEEEDLHRNWHICIVCSFKLEQSLQKRASVTTGIIGRQI